MPPPDPAAMGPGEVASRSPLDKPFADLTDEDIAQLTREDCRRFLKAKGMRRPSWNKSQAIQQVISLKALFEGRPGCDDSPAGGGILRKLPPVTSAPVSPPQNSPPPATEEGSGGGGSGAQPPAKEPSPYRRKDPFPPPFFAGDLTCSTPIAELDRPHPPENRCFSPRTTADLPGEQMTIFYDGMINVYDDVSADQARAIMELAASPACFEDPTDPLPPARRPVFRLPPGPAPPFARAFRIRATGRMPHRVAGGLEGRRVPRETEHEVPTSRKASLQRYLEKRKDRFKGKKILGGSTSSDMEMMYISQKLRCLNHSELPNLNETSFPSLSQPPQSPARCSSAENQSGEKYFIDLNDDSGGI
ncbi:protein TIFY 4B-like [Musa acuminata AAA Group]|uniref:protein TIFY 4B-like n=1 Tax=Musa acuminata AAA Group TaxID=214697 RepID=UPI0031D8BF53